VSCGWCGHGHCPACGYGHCHHYGHGYEYGPPRADYGQGYGPPRRLRRRAREEDLAAYLEDLEEEVSQVREDLERLRRSRPAEES
jgi:hypothetical protein